MRKNNRLMLKIFLCFYVVFFSGLGFSEPENLGLLKQTLHQYHDSGAYNKELAQQIDQAYKDIIHTIRTNAKRAHPKKLAIVLDIDETSLSNYKYMVSRDFATDREKIHHDILAADAPAIEPMLPFYRKMLKEGVAIFFITGRKESEQQATIRNLNSVGYHHWTGIYFKSSNEKSLSNIPFKTRIRKMISKSGYTIIASIGDQYCDLRGGYTERMVKLPNPYYYLP